MDLGGRKWYQSKCRPHIPTDFCTHYTTILHRLATIHNAADDRRQIDGNRSPPPICYSIGGLIKSKTEGQLGLFYSHSYVWFHLLFAEGVDF